MRHIRIFISPNMRNTDSRLQKDSGDKKRGAGKKFPVIGIIAGRKDVVIEERLVVDSHAGDGLSHGGKASEAGEHYEAGDYPEGDARGIVVLICCEAEIGIGWRGRRRRRRSITFVAILIVTSDAAKETDDGGGKGGKRAW